MTRSRKRHRGSGNRTADRRPSATPHGDTTPAPAVAGRRADLMIVLALAAGSFILDARTFTYPYVDYDDLQYVYQPMVERGLMPAGVRWAFTTTTFANWLPVTWLSHMLACSLYGLNHPVGHHATSAA